MFLVNQLGIADRNERIQAMESVLELPRSVGHFVRVPKQDELPPGPLATLRLDPHLLQLGLATPEELSPAARDEDDRDRRRVYDEERDVGADAGRQAPPAVRLRFPRRPRPADLAGLGGGRAAAVRRRFQQVRHQQEPAKAGRHGLPPRAAADPAW